MTQRLLKPVNATDKLNMTYYEKPDVLFFLIEDTPMC
jgi:hypothetical protein